MQAFRCSTEIAMMIDAKVEYKALNSGLSQHYETSKPSLQIHDLFRRPNKAILFIPLLQSRGTKRRQVSQKLVQPLIAKFIARLGKS